MTIQEKIQNKENQIGKLVKKFDKYSKLVSEEFLALINQYLRTGDYTPIKEYRTRKYPRSYFLEGDDYTLYATASDLYSARNTLEKYNKQLIVTEAKNQALNEMPAVLVEFKNNLINRWDAYDEWKKQTIRKEYSDSHNHREMREKWGAGWYEFMYITTEQIHTQNVKDAETLVLNLINRTIEITGKITDAKYLRIGSDNNGYSIINGIVIGEKGKASVTSIGAGGYNIQRYHIRVLVKEVLR